MIESGLSVTVRRRTPVLGLVLAVLVPSTCLLAGCGVKVGVQESSPSLREGLVPGAVLAVAGVGASPAVGRLDPADAADAADQLQVRLLAAFPQLVVMSRAATAGTAGEARLDSLLGEYARLQAVDPGRAREVGAALPEARYLVLASVVADAIETQAVRQDLADPEARAEGQAEQGSPWGQAVSTERRTAVTLSLIDLADGTTAWHGRAEVADRIRYEYHAPEIDPRAIAPAPAREGPPVIPRTGGAVRAPDLVELLGRGFAEMAARLPGSSTRSDD